jgi:hypothetical protein
MLERQHTSTATNATTNNVTNTNTNTTSNLTAAINTNTNTASKKLGDADDAVFKTVNSKQGVGTVSQFTRLHDLPHDFHFLTIIDQTIHSPLLARCGSRIHNHGTRWAR